MNNPLRQYFRRPALYLRLPSGGEGYPEGVIEMTPNGELPVFPMTAIDEITTKTPDALFNGTAMAEIIKSCVPNIKDPWQVTSVDFDAILIAIRAAGGGNEVELESQCPSCKELATYGVNLTNILSQLKEGNYKQELVINELRFKFRPLTYREMNDAALGQFEVQRMFLELEKVTDDDAKNKETQNALRKVTELTMKILSQTIDSISTPTDKVDNKEFVLDFLKNCDKDIYTQVRDYNAELKAQTDIKPLKIKCIHCQHEYEQPFTLNTADFFA